MAITLLSRPAASKRIWLSNDGIVKSGLVAWYKFDEGAGQVLTDYKDGNHGQLGSTAGEDANDPTWGATGLSFDGGDYVTCGTATELDLDSGSRRYSLVIAFKQDIDAPSPLIGKNTFGLNGWGLYISSKKICFQVRGSGLGHIIASPTAGTLGSSYLATGIRSGGQLMLYKDGDLIEAKSTTEEPSTSAAAFVIGSRAPMTSYFLTGDVYYALAYAKPLTRAEVVQNYRAIKKELAGRGVVLS